LRESEVYFFGILVKAVSFVPVIVGIGVEVLSKVPGSLVFVFGVPVFIEVERVGLGEVGF